MRLIMMDTFGIDIKHMEFISLHSIEANQTGIIIVKHSHSVHYPSSNLILLILSHVVHILIVFKILSAEAPRQRTSASPASASLISE